MVTKSLSRIEAFALADRMVVAVARELKVGHRSLLGESRCQHVVRPRYIAIHAIHSITGLGVKAIADMFCRDHTSILYALSRAQVLMAENPELAAAYDKILTEFTGGLT